MQKKHIEELTHATVRIETTYPSGAIGTGSGFFMRLLEDEENPEARWVLAIITNRHVLKGATTARLSVSTSEEASGPGRLRRKNEPPIKIDLHKLESGFIEHPDPDIDLAAIPVPTRIVEETLLITTPLTMAMIPSEGKLSEFSPMEEVVMVGYPRGMWDQVNNLPIIRRGITATHPGVAYNGKPEFLTDIAAWPGSSGSPIVATERRMEPGPGYGLRQIERAWLIGIHYAGAVFTANGELAVRPEPDNVRVEARTAIPMNLGIAVRSRELIALEAAVGVAIGIRPKPGDGTPAQEAGDAPDDDAPDDDAPDDDAPDDDAPDDDAPDDDAPDDDAPDDDAPDDDAPDDDAPDDDAPEGASDHPNHEPGSSPSTPT